MTVRHKSFILMVSLCLMYCEGSANFSPASDINFSHLNHLYEDIVMDGDTVGIVHIYCEYPDYKWVDDSDEGIACVDDVARAAVAYMNYYQISKEEYCLHRARKLLTFVMKLQSANGWYYNFIFEDYSINRSHKNSEAIAGWWTWRAVWSLLRGYDVFQNIDPGFSAKIKIELDSVLPLIKDYLPTKKENENYEGLSIPTYLPYGSASDQAALLIICLTDYARLFNDTSVVPYIKTLADGILEMQEGSKEEYPYGAFLCYQNIWHGWGSLQSYSLLYASKILQDNMYQQAALFEIENFHRYLIKTKFLQEFSISKKNGVNEINYERQFPQIAYQLRTMIYASAEAYKVTNDKQYISFAEEILRWFYGQNVSGENMYDRSTGRCFDGIQSEAEVNYNSGAESTIEALLAYIQIALVNR